MDDDKETKIYHWPVNINSRGWSRFWYIFWTAIYIGLTVIGPVITAICVSGIASDKNFGYKVAAITLISAVIIILKIISVRLQKLDIYYYKYRLFTQIYNCVIGVLIPGCVIALCIIIGKSAQATIDSILLTIEISAGLIAGGILVDRLFCSECRSFFQSLNVADKLYNAHTINQHINR